MISLPTTEECKQYSVLIFFTKMSKITLYVSENLLGSLPIIMLSCGLSDNFLNELVRNILNLV